MALWAWAITAALLITVNPILGKSSTKNPADKLSNAINQNRTASKLLKLYDNPGLACIALQYIQAYDGKCSEVGANGERPSEDAFKSTLSENCGVDPSSVSDITGIVLACESTYKDADYAFSQLLFKEEKTLATLQNRNQTEMGTGVSGYEGGSPYFWCVLFSNGTPPTSTFNFVQGKAKFQKTGCFSGTGEACSSSFSLAAPSTSLLLFSLAVLMLY